MLSYDYPLLNAILSICTFLEVHIPIFLPFHFLSKGLLQFFSPRMLRTTHFNEFVCLQIYYLAFLQLQLFNSVELKRLKNLRFFQLFFCFEKIRDRMMAKDCWLRHLQTPDKQ
jgi:hypothetical protein